MTFTSLVLWALAAAPLAAQEEGKRVALVIGNDAYSIRPLQNAVNDARSIQRALAGAGFKVILRENASRTQMEEAAVEFISAIGPGDTALFYYAGHAVQIENENVLIPVDFDAARTVIEAKFKSFSLARVFEYLKQSRAGTTILVIDACRSNPVAERYSLRGGLATPLDAGKSTYIAYSTSPNKVATDNPNGHNSWFTEALADAISQEGLPLDDVFTRVRLKVENSTGGAQTPWSYTSLTKRFYFHRPKNAEAAAEASLVEKWLADSRRQEQYGNWLEAADLAGRVVKQKPGGTTEDEARTRLPYLQARQEAQDRFDAGDFTKAAEHAEQALKLEPFDTEAAFDAANSALLIGQFPRAVAALEAVRKRGTSASVAKADAMLKELASIEPSAQEALKRGLAKPPALAEMFPNHRFAAPDLTAGRRYARQGAPVDFASVTKLVPPPPPPPPPPPAAPVAAPQPVETAAAVPMPSADELHVEVKTLAGASRDLTVEEFGELTIKASQKEMTVLIDGRPVTKLLPFTAKLPPGDYEIRTVESGKTRNERRIKVMAGEPAALELR